MTDWVEIHKDPQHIAREKQKAKTLRQSQWWRNKMAQGVCAYCQQTFAPDALTMDHRVPLARGGRSTKGNVVPCCKACNATKRYWTPAELVLQQLKGQATRQRGHRAYKESMGMGIQGTTFRGVVVAGRGLGAPSMSHPTLLHAVQQWTDLTFVPGTLNVRLPHPFEGPLPGYLTEEELGGHVWRDYAPHRQGIRYGEVLIAGRYRGILFQGDEPAYPLEQVELLSDHHLRATLGLQDGDMVEFTLLPDQGTGKRP